MIRRVFYIAGGHYIARVRDRFWAAFWRRQERYLKPGVFIQGGEFYLEEGAGPAISVGEDQRNVTIVGVHVRGQQPRVDREMR